LIILTFSVADVSYRVAWTFYTHFYVYSIGTITLYNSRANVHATNQNNSLRQ
jgi:hypothetical protein